jgi:signal transduction histidine kinase
LILIKDSWKYRDDPGGVLFTGVAVCMLLSSLSLGLGFLVFDPVLREVFELSFHFWAIGAPTFWVAFAFVYTGRGHLLRSRAFRGVLAVMGLMTVLVVTNPIHHLVWSDFEVVTTAGVAGAAYTREPAFYLLYLLFILLVGIPMVPLLSTLWSYGPLYRTQATALAVTPTFVGTALVLWVFGIGPFPHINFVGMAVGPHMVLDLYALFWGDMFQFPPSVRHISENASIDDVGMPVFIVDEDGRVITLNKDAETKFEVGKYDILGDSVNDVVKGDRIDLDETEQLVSINVGGVWGEYSVSSKPLLDGADRNVGYTISLRDVTAQLRRKQRLEVQSRVLRHNLRNDLTVIQGHLGILKDALDDEELAPHVETIAEKSRNLGEVGEKTKEFSQAMADAEGDRDWVDVHTVLDEVGTSLRERFPAGSISIDIDREIELHSNRRLLALIFEGLIENGLEHGGVSPSVSVEAEAFIAEENVAVFRVSDDGPGIPDHELDVIDRGEETALEHGSGLGLWLVVWCVRVLGGTISFETGDTGTTVRLRLPGINEPAAPGKRAEIE